ncbi:alpha/beta hydrolase [Alkalicoccus daliensis]|uniref:Serine aminopeptidase S33 domain-containing protein n=1 Tax=Alkalicoccus daliensis TaxID=745820 RepID=A0A1H0EWX8_9BACI|nr:alpha/beta hydrolase [Alkalicoccus daliensis]SDN86843.1 hypothetical protein SAMN04488053_104101 [Alkalicoccus daliensis]
MLSILAVFHNKWITGAGIAGLLAIFLLGLLYFFQERLIFYPQTMTEEEVQRVADSYPNAEEISFTAEDGTALHGWLVHASPEAEVNRLLIYYGGNAEELSGQIPMMSEHLENWSVLLVNYRGYGASEGSLDEEKMYEDALLIHDEIQAQYPIETLAVMGRSIGTAVAVNTAAERTADNVILVSPFDSFKEVAGHHYPFLPVSLLLRYTFPSEEKINDISAPLLVIAAEEDQVIPGERTRALLAQREGGAETVWIPNRGHNDMHVNTEFWDAIRAFLPEES